VPGAPGGKIELVALTKRFTEVAVDSIDLTVSSGEFFSLVYLGSSTQVILRLAAGTQLNVLLQNDGTGQSLAQGTPVHAYLAPDALRVLTGEGRAAVDADDALQVTGPPVSA
jgi:ABC-type sugar transport system ATPase subunit